MIRAALLSLALCLPAHAQAPMVTSELDCGTLQGKGRVTLVLGGSIRAVINVECGRVV